MENYTRVGTPVQVFSETFGFLAGQIAKVEGSRVDVICPTTDGGRYFDRISHVDFYEKGDVRPFWRHVPKEHCHSESL